MIELTLTVRWWSLKTVIMKTSRSKKLKGPEKTLFSGEFWTGEKSVELGLTDRLGEIKTVLRERYGKKVETPLVSPSTSWFSKKTPGVSFDGDWASTLISAMEARALWSRYGL